MEELNEIKGLGWRHPLWDLLRFYRAIGRRGRAQDEWLKRLSKERLFTFPGTQVPPILVSKEIAELLPEYVSAAEKQAQQRFTSLRTEKEAVNFCQSLGVAVTRTRTQSRDHHQSPKALVGAVTYLATEFCKQQGMDIEANPQNRCVWTKGQALHVTARRLDGAIPSLVNPRLIWEIKEYWGKTSGGSKMSDAVYECQLVGRELREFEEYSKQSIYHVVFLDGLEQWQTRRSDFVRFIDLANQGLIDFLVIGREVERDWGRILHLLLESD